MKKTIVLILALISIGGYAQEINRFFNESDVFLKKYVNNGKVAYSEIYKNKDALNELFAIANSVSVSKENAKIYQAFWINAYNLSVIKGVIDQYPIKSPLDKKGFFDVVKYNLAGQKVTLNDIENKILREQFNDARFHFVLVCGAVGCPPLINKAYMPSTLEQQLEQQTKEAINGDFLKVDTKKKRVKVSQIMEWYKNDFTINNKTEIDFINTYRTEKLEGRYKLSYFPYNWNLNKQ